MKTIKMKFRDFEFPVNPSSIVITSDRNVNISHMADGTSAAGSVSLNPVVVSGEGEFYTDEAESYCEYLAHLLREGRSGWLFVPLGEPIKAFLTEFSYSKSVRKNCISYQFTFTQERADKKEIADLGYTYALKGENAFDIAHRERVSVSEIMLKNDFRTPFSIIEGDRVILR